MAPQRQTTPSWKPHRRLQGAGTNYGLRATQAFTNTAVRYEVVPVAGMAKITARIKTATQGGTLDIFFIGPDVDVEGLVKNDTAYASIVGTTYTTGKATQGAVVAGTEQLVTVACSGEDYALIVFTGGGTGTITFCDVSCLSTGLS